MSQCCTLVYLEVFRLVQTDTVVLRDLVSLGNKAVKHTDAELGGEETGKLSPNGQQFGGKQCDSFRCCTEAKGQAATKAQAATSASSLYLREQEKTLKLLYTLTDTHTTYERHSRLPEAMLEGKGTA